MPVYQKWSRGHKALGLGQGQGHKKKIRGQGQPFRGQALSRPRPRPRTQAQVLSKKKVFTKIFQAISTKKRFPKNFPGAPQNFNGSKNSAVLEPRTGQFSRTWGLEAKDRPIFEDLRPRGQGLDLRGQGQWFQNVSSRTLRYIVE